MKRVTYFVSAAVLLVGATTYSQHAGRRPENRSRHQPAARLRRYQDATSPQPPRRCPRPTTASSRLDARGADLRAGDRAHRAGAVRPVLGTEGRAEPDAGQEPRAGAEDESGSHQGARRLVRAVRRRRSPHVTDANATEMVKAGQNEVTRAAALYGVIVHGNEIAGTAYAYLRRRTSCRRRPSARRGRERTRN